jgi:hypothetical protein
LPVRRGPAIILFLFHYIAIRRENKPFFYRLSEKLAGLPGGIGIPYWNGL